MKMNRQRLLAQRAEVSNRNDWTEVSVTAEPRFGMENINVRYGLSREINKKQSKFLNSKATFLAKFNNLRQNGEKQEVIKKIEMWVESNIDKLWEMSQDGNHDHAKHLEDTAFMRKLTNSGFKHHSR